jgi:tetratricopeptide (TPR) repeat protein
MRKMIVPIIIVSLGLLVTVGSFKLSAAQNPGVSQSEFEKCLESCRQEIAKGRADEAVALAEKAIALEPAKASGQYQLALAYNLKVDQASGMGKLGPAKKFKAALEKAVELDPGLLPARQALMGYLLQAPGLAGGSIEKGKIQAAEIAKLDEKAGYRARAAVFQAEKKWDQAEAEWKSLLALESNSFDVAASLSAFYQSREDLTKAEATLQTYLDAHPQDAAVHLSLGQLLVTANRLDRAGEVFRAGLALGGDGRNFYYQLGKLAAVTGKDPEAGLDHLKKYLEAPAPPGRPTHADAWWRIGNIYEKMGRNVDAAAAYQKALDINPDHANAKTSMKALKK